MTAQPFELGVYSFVEHGVDPRTGQRQSPAQSMRDVVEQIELADQVGLDAFGVGEHHRDDFLASNPEVILAAAVSQTKRIKLGSAVTVLSSADPVRVYQAFATLDLLSNGRAEIVAGRGSFIESFPLFGYDLNDYHELFTEKLELLLKIRDQEVVTWVGEHRASLDGRGVYPRAGRQLPIWVGVGGTPESAVRAGTLGLPMALAIIGGYPEQFKPFVDLFRASAEDAGHNVDTLPVSINSHGYIADDPKQALDESWPGFSAVMNKIGKERGWSPMQRAQFDASASLRGANFIGGPEQIVDKILYQHRVFQHDRLMLKISMGGLPQAKILRAIELLGTQVAPVVRAEIARATEAA
jgi:probable LLM family oxidoreductase